MDNSEEIKIDLSSDPEETTESLSSLPSLIEAPHTGDLSSDFAMNTLFSKEELNTAMARSAALESLLTLAVSDCNFNDYVLEILMTIMKIVKCEAGSILEVNHQEQNLFFRSVVGSKSDRVVNFMIPLGQGIVGHVAQERLPMVVDNASDSDKHLRAIAEAVGFEARNLVAIPIVVRGKIYGVLELLNRLGEATFSPADVELLSYLCTMAAKAIEIRMMIAWSRQKQEDVAA